MDMGANDGNVSGGGGVQGGRGRSGNNEQGAGNKSVQDLWHGISGVHGWGRYRGDNSNGGGVVII